MKKRAKICQYAYTRAEIIGMNGDVTFCCPSYTDFYILGNLHKQSFEEIWNGERARNIRKSMLDGSFKYCHTDMCCEGEGLLIPAPEGTTDIAPPPETLEIGVSTICNCQCTMCRKNSKPTKEELEPGFYDKMRAKYLPIIKTAKVLSLNNYGEVLIDKHCKRLLKYALAINKNLRLKLLTNGVFANEKTFKEYGIMDNVDTISVSVHAATKETYDSIVKHGNFEKVQQNLEWLAEQKAKGKIKTVLMNFVVQQKNYKEMIDFAKWAKKLNLECDFWEVRIDEDNIKIWTEYTQENLYNIAKNNLPYDFSEYYQAAVHLPKHPEHAELAKIVKHPIFKEEFCYINDLLLNC